MSLNTSELRNPALRKYADDHLNYAGRFLYLGTPVVADVDRIVTSANMKVGAYTVAAQPDIPRNVTVTVTAGDTADTMGTVVVVGTDINGNALTETITPVAGSTVAGTKAFKTVTSVTGAGWVIDGSEGTNDTITVGVGNLLGLPILIAAAANCRLGIVGTALVTPTTAAGTIDGCTVDLSAGTYNGTKAAFAIVVE